MYPVELETKDTAESNTSASYQDLLMSIGRNGQLYTSDYNKQDDSNFHIANFPFLRSNIPSWPAYGNWYQSLYDMPRLCPHMDVLFYGQGNFLISYLNRETS